MQFLETERLILRPFNLKDIEFIVELLNTESWIKYIGDRNVKTKEQAKLYLENGPLKSYKENGFGLYLVEQKSNHQSIGMCGLIKRGYLNQADLGFAFLDQFTGQGYAFESSIKILELAKETLHMSRILAITIPDNLSSIKLLEKIGFKFQNEILQAESNEVLSLYEIRI